MQLADQNPMLRELKVQCIALREELEEKADDLQHMQSINEALILKEQMSNRELQNARKELINVRIYLPGLFSNKWIQIDTVLPFCF